MVEKPDVSILKLQTQKIQRIHNTYVGGGGERDGVQAIKMCFGLTRRVSRVRLSPQNSSHGSPRLLIQYVRS